MLMSREIAVPRAAMNGAILAIGGMMLALGAVLSLAQAGAAAAILLAVVSTGASAVLARRLLGAVPPVVTAALVLGASAPLLLLASLWREHGQFIHWSSSGLVAVLFLAVIPGALAYALWFWLLQHLQAYQMATVQWMEPLVALGEGAVLLRMGWSFAMVAGSALVMASLWMVLRARPEDDKSVSLWSN
jgi:probable blue pigment (indigoidine) exporter